MTLCYIMLLYYSLTYIIVYNVMSNYNNTINNTIHYNHHMIILCCKYYTTGMHPFPLDSALANISVRYSLPQEVESAYSPALLGWLRGTAAICIAATIGMNVLIINPHP